MSANDARSATMVETCGLPLSAATSSRAAERRRSSRARSTTVAPSRARPSAVALPSPRLAPVTTHTRPLMSLSAIDAASVAVCGDISVDARVAGSIVGACGTTADDGPGSSIIGES
jgi:hypothetical protein